MFTIKSSWTPPSTGEPAFPPEAGTDPAPDARPGKALRLKASVGGVLARLLRTYLRPYKSLLVAVVGLQLIQTIATLYLPKLNGDIIDRGVATGNTNYIWHTGLIMVSISAVQIVASVGAVYFAAKSAMTMGGDLRAAVFRRVGMFSAREVGSFGAPTLITRNTNDVQQVQMVAFMGCNMFVSAPIMVVGGVVMALREDAGLSWLLLVCVPILVGAVGTIMSRLIPQFRVMQPKIDKINQILREQISGIRVVRAFVREDLETDKFASANADLTNTAMRVGRLMSMTFPTVMLVFNASSVAVLWFGAHRIAAGDVQIGSLIAFLTYLMQILMSVMMATFMATMIPRAAVCADRIQEVLDTDSSVVPPENPVETVTGHGSLEFRGAEFRYPGAGDPVLQDISFSVKAGQTTAIIGSTGSGKTTLISLIPRLFDTTDGSVIVDGVDVRELAPEKLTKLVGLVPQKPYLFSGTVAGNLRYGNPDATDEQLWDALRVSQAEQFVRDMPDQLDAPISQGGTNVSGGQRQRLAIARALLREPEIYLFDDSLSALDLATDARLRAALKPKVANAAVVIVAQRVSTIYRADQIVVLDDGVIVGIGTHDELRVTCPTYVEIVESQMTGDEAA